MPPIVHLRSFEKGKETVVKSHLHPKHEAMILLPLSEFIDWAEDYGERTKQFITKLFAGKPDVEANQVCKGVQSIASKYQPEEVEAATDFCMRFGKYSPTALKHVLASGVHMDDPKLDVPTVGLHSNLRGSQHYQQMGRQA